MSPLFALRLGAAFLGLAFLAAPARAQGVTPAACDGVVSRPADLRFDHERHRLWYRRFWTGDCSGLGLFCQSGHPNWTRSLTTLAARATPATRRAVIVRACRLGEKVGLEWARDNDVRRIDTQAVTRFGARLDRSANPDADLAAVEAQADAMLTRR